MLDKILPKELKWVRFYFHDYRKIISFVLCLSMAPRYYNVWAGFTIKLWT